MILKSLFKKFYTEFDNWTNESSGWIVQSNKSQYFNISAYRPLVGTSYKKLPAKLRSSKKD